MVVIKFVQIPLALIPADATLDIHWLDFQLAKMIMNAKPIFVDLTQAAQTLLAHTNANVMKGHMTARHKTIQIH
jgi:membrane-bound acyltransferase YfiQ involved in biofilm formation